MNEQELVKQYAMKHAAEPGYGPGACWHCEVEAFARLAGATSILDYGCGKGGLVRYLRERGYAADGYDPAVPCWQEAPAGPYDMVTCLDVMEHVRLADVAAVLRRIAEHVDVFGRVGVFFSICTRPAVHCLPNGRNCHETVREKEWWAERLAGAFPLSEWSAVVDQDAPVDNWNVGLLRE